jgi:S1-C subfamily serine protease
MERLKRHARTPFASALLGGLVVAVVGLVAIAAGLVKADDDSPTIAATPLTEPASDTGGGKGHTVNQIYEASAPGVAHIEAAVEPKEPEAFSPFGPQQGQGGTATGSGFVIDDEGHLLTNAHVVAGAEEVKVTLTEDGDTFDAKVVGRDPSTDVALLDVDAPSDQLTPLPLGDSDDVQVGDAAVAIGNPFGLDRTATAGIVSAVQRSISAPNGFTISDAIQTDAPINPGNSGGPLFDAAGRVIGINSQIESPNGGGNVGIGFAVPINTAQTVAEQLLDGGEVEHAFLGISGGDVTPEIADVLNLSVDHGAIVQDVVPDGPADDAGVEPGDTDVTIAGQQLRAGGDVITEVDGEEVTGMDDVIAAVNAKQPGDEVELTLVRKGDERTVSVELGDRPANASP